MWAGPLREARRAQKRIEAARQASEIPDLLLLLEHPPVYTKGRRTEPGELAMGEDWYRMQGIEVCETDRGGRVTYHGPGQLVGYPIVSLKPYGDDVHDYVRRLERLMISSLAAYGIEAEVIDGLTGVGWRRAAAGTEGRLDRRPHQSRGDHPRLRGQRQQRPPALRMGDPLWDRGVRMTSICRELGAAQDLAAYMDVVGGRFCEIYDRTPVEIEAGELSKRVPGTDAGRRRAARGARPGTASRPRYGR